MKKLITNLLQKAGYEIQRSRNIKTALKGAFVNSHVKSVVDIGANRGDSVKQWRELFPSAHISCFEPVKENYCYLQQRFEHDAAVALYSEAVSNENGMLEIKLSTGHSTHSFLRRAINKKYGPPASERGRTETVKATTLDSWMTDQQVPHIDLVKIDTEGFEANVLEGAAEALRTQSIDIVMIELMFIPIYEGQELYFELAQRLDKLGYSIYDMPRIRRHSDGQIRWVDGIFLSAHFRER